MEPKFQTSFIPKKPVLTPVSGAMPRIAPQTRSVFMSLAVLLFVLALLSVAGAYGWKYYLTQAQDDFKLDLANREKQFNIDQIEQLKQINVQIDTAKDLVNNHISASELFNIVSRFTIEKVRFSSLQLSIDKSSITVDLKGEGTSLSALAFQSDVLGALDQYDLRGIVKNPIMSGVTKQLDGKYSFGMTTEIENKALLYSKFFTAVPDNSSTTPQ